MTNAREIKCDINVKSFGEKLTGKCRNDENWRQEVFLWQVVWCSGENFFKIYKKIRAIYIEEGHDKCPMTKISLEKEIPENIPENICQ